jgi:hypothetical protein
MPWVSKAQERWGNSIAGHQALGSKVNEFNKATTNQKGLPDHVPQKKTRNSIMKKLMKNKKKI